MLITFQSEATGDVIMFGDVAEQLLSVIGKSMSKSGIVTVEQLPNAIRQLKQAATDSKAQPKDDDEKDDKPTGGRISVSLSQRAFPLIDLFERALKAKVPVTWGT